MNRAPTTKRSTSNPNPMSAPPECESHGCMYPRPRRRQSRRGGPAGPAGRHLQVSRPVAIVCLWALAAFGGGVLCARAAAQAVTPQLGTTTEATTPTTEAQTTPTTARAVTTRPTVARTVPRRVSTTGPSTTPPTTVPTTVAGTLPPTTAGPAPALSTIPVADTRPGEGKMPAWPLALSGIGFAGAGGILGRQWVRSRPR